MQTISMLKNKKKNIFYIRLKYFYLLRKWKLFADFLVLNEFLMTFLFHTYSKTLTSKTLANLWHVEKPLKIKSTKLLHDIYLYFEDFLIIHVNEENLLYRILNFYLKIFKYKSRYPKSITIMENII